MSVPLLEVRNLRKYYPVVAGLLSHQVGCIKAVDGVSFEIGEGETLGLVGESGCGKSTLGRTIIKLEEPTSGQIIYRGKDITALAGKDMRSVRRKIQMIFQDPQSSLDPRMTVEATIGEALDIRGIGDDHQREEHITHLLGQVGMETRLTATYPHELSGGQKQRIGIARALAMNPNLIISDEPVSALDVAVQAQILNLMVDLQEQMGLTYLFIAHDLSVIKHLSHHIAVMYLGKIVEKSPKKELFEHPGHPYTQALISAATGIHGRRGERILLPGDVPSPMNPPSGCHFHTRCRHKQPLCTQEEPELREIQPGHWLACHQPC